MEKVEPPRAPVGWLRLLALTGCLFVGLVLLHIAVVPPDLKWLLWGKWVLAALFVIPIGLLTLLELSPLFFRRKCASCGKVVYEHIACGDPCPHCDRPFDDVTNLMPQDGSLLLREHVSDRRPVATILGLPLALAIRDGVNEIRFVGRDDGDAPEAPRDLRSWRIWFHQKSAVYEVVPPPPLVGMDIFRLLKEFYRRAQKEAATGPTCFDIVIDDYAETVELVIEESAEEDVAKIVFTSEAPRPWAGGDLFLKDYFESRCPETERSASNC